MSRTKSIIATALGALMIVWVVVLAFPYVRTLQYRSVSGTVLSADIKSVEAGRINLQQPVVTYAYSVDGRRYENDAFDPLEDDGTRKWANEVLNRYPVGRACTVYYDPTHPQRSVLSTIPNYKSMWIGVLFVFLGGIHLLAGVVTLRNCTLKALKV